MTTKQRNPRTKKAAAAPSINWHVTPYKGGRRPLDVDGGNFCHNGP